MELQAAFKQAVEALAQSAPWALRAMGEALTGRELLVCVDNEQLAVRAPDGTLEWGAPGATANVHARAKRRGLAALLDGEVTLEGALLDGSLDVRGKIEHVLGALDAQQAFARGALRCPELITLGDEFLGRAGGLEDSWTGAREGAEQGKER